MSKASARFTLEGLGNPHDGKTIKRELDRLPGVLSVSLSDNSDCVTVDFDTTGVQAEQIGKRLEKMGYPVQHIETQTNNV